MKSKRQLRSKIYMEDRHFHSVKYHHVSSEMSHCLVKAKVMPSIPTQNKKKNPDHDVWVCLSKVTGNVHSAQCNCTAGEGECCNHVGALLYTLEDISQRRQDGTLSCTSNPCKWNNPRKRKLSPMKAGDIYKKRTMSGSEPSKTNMSSVNVENFRQKLFSHKCQAGFFTFFPKPTPALPQLHKIYFNFCDTTSLTSVESKLKIEEIFNSMKVSEEDIVRIEKCTRGQFKNSLWKEARSERVTSSSFGKVCKMKEFSSPDNVVRDILNYTSVDSKFLKWGRDHEAAARRMYGNQAAKIHDNFHLNECGLLINPEHPHLGTSPDGLVSCSCCGEGVVEIKCPASDKWKFKTPVECAEDKKFYCGLDENRS